MRVRNGISVTSNIVPVDEFLPLAETINGALEMWGGWFFQVKRTATGELALLRSGHESPALHHCRESGE